MINSVNELLYRAVGAVETGLLAAPAKSLGFGRQQQGTTDTAGGGDEGPEPAAKAEIENGVHQLETLLEATIDRNFDKLEIYLLRSVLAIPEEVAPWIRLEHYEVRTARPFAVNFDRHERCCRTSILPLVPTRRRRSRSTCSAASCARRRGCTPSSCSSRAVTPR